MVIPESTKAFLLDGEPWVRYTALRSIPGLASAAGAAAALGSNAAAGAALVEEARQAAVASPLMHDLADTLMGWPGKVLASHKSAEQSFHRLSFAAELGLRAVGPDVAGRAYAGPAAGGAAIAAKVMAHPSLEGPFALPMNIGAAHGGTGEDAYAWALCDAPVILRALIRMGLGSDPRVARSVEYLVSLVRPNGYPCAVSPVLGSFRGPGKKSDPCPYATLAMLELLQELPDRRNGKEALCAAECLLGLWERSRDDHPYIFYMGTDFRKLKAPMIWYDLVHVLDALSSVEPIREDPRLHDMVDVLAAKMDQDLRFTPESVYLAWKAYDFGQKKTPSAYLTALALGILVRTGRVGV